jgi:DNA-directed RNA polymerase specialized sigma24 family protein
MRVAESFEALRPMLFSLAYRMLGSVSEAEDVVQEAFLRQQRALRQDTEIDAPKAYLSAVVTRLSIDQRCHAEAMVIVLALAWLYVEFGASPAIEIRANGQLEKMIQKEGARKAHLPLLWRTSAVTDST